MAIAHSMLRMLSTRDNLTLLSIRFTKTGNTLCMSNNIEELNGLEPFLNDFFECENLDLSI
ncbi:MAG: hypothetical protein K5901_00005 [Bacteroidales bacterium]|nr:hypothetical protein [Bacteroidales bacterium]